MPDGSNLIQPVEQIIIIRRGQPEEPHAKGGAWKIAYADFVTAMMAFFLVMWLINAANEKTKAQVASYFNPIKLVDSTTSKRGLADSSDHSKSGDHESEVLQAGETQHPSNGKSTEDTSHSQVEKEADKKPEANGQEGDTKAPRHDTSIFDDPYHMLDELAESDLPQQGQPAGKTIIIPHIQEAGASGGPAFRDRFDPFAWKYKGISEEPIPKKQDSLVQTAARPSQPVAENPSFPPPALASKAVSDPETVRLLAEAQRIREFLMQDLTTLGKVRPGVSVKAEPAGILISLTDNLDFDMFDIGSAKPKPVVVRLMEKVAAAVRNSNDKIVIRGHTDARRYRGLGNDNWRLSMERAQMAYYMLSRAGIADIRIERIEGYADKSPLKEDDPQAKENRRIEILLEAKKQALDQSEIKGPEARGP